MTVLNEGDKAPDFTLPSDSNSEISLSAFKGKKTVLYFYPKDDTPGCTQESCDFRDNIKEFEKLNVQIIGISKDSVARHDKFKTKYNLSFPLASDENGTVCEDYGTWTEKNLYGRKYMGIERTTFLIDENGIIRKIWNKVKVKGHIDEIRAVLEEMKEAA